MKTLRKLLKLALIILPTLVFADSGKVDLQYGYFNINSKAGGKSASISNLSAMRVGYLKPFSEHFVLSLGYTVILADFSGSDLGYGLDLGANYFPLSSSKEGSYKDEFMSAKRFQNYMPYVGLGFYQRQFQSIKNSYAGLGTTVGLEKYHNEKLNFKVEGRFIQLGGSDSSTATEMNLLFGVVFKL